MHPHKMETYWQRRREREFKGKLNKIELVKGKNKTTILRVVNVSNNLFQLPKVEKSVLDVQGKREDAPNNQNGNGVITKVVDSSSHLPQSSSADIKIMENSK